MIGSLRGTVIERLAESTVLIEVSGVGYLVHVTPRTLAELEPTSSAFLYVHQHVREDALTMYGFLDRDERRTFESLIATHGIGPSMAMAILATHSARALTDIVSNGDVASLTLVPGVGKKTAERLLIELKGRLNLPTLDGFPSASTSSVAQVREALVGLGYGHDEIRDALRELDSASDAERLLRDALNLLGSRRA